jgi:putative glutamine amidotransferase
MPNLATWMRPKDEKWFGPVFARYPEVQVWNVLIGLSKIPIDQMDGLLLTGGADISEEFLRQPVPDPSILEKDAEPERDRWEFAAIEKALERGLPILAICKGLQVLNVALGGTLKLDIAGHNLPEMKDHNIQPLRNDSRAPIRFEKVNSSHHQAVERLADRCEVEAWCATDDIIEQFRLRDYPYGLAVQYHPERDARTYAPLFEDFFDRINKMTRMKKHSADSVHSV